jgi:hypothetical protein
VREIDDQPATVWWGVQVRQSNLHIAQCITRVQEFVQLCFTDTFILASICPRTIVLAPVLFIILRVFNNAIAHNIFRRMIR